MTDKPDYFSNSSKIVEASAPGRLDVMGGVADYSGSLLLQMPISRRTTVSMQKREDPLLKIFSAETGDPDMNPLVELDLTRFELSRGHVDYRKIRNEITKTPGNSWCLYVAGCFFLCIEEGSIPLQGANVHVESEVPLGKGVSSSAAIEVATLKAMEKAFGFSLGKLALPIRAQKVENLVVGAPCGLMDPLSSYLGEEDKLLPIVCQPAQVFDAIAIPQGLAFVGIDSDVKHSVAGDAYKKVRTAAFMGYTLVAMEKGATAGQLHFARDTGNWDELPYSGYLANIEKCEFERSLANLLPESMTGKEFLDDYSVSIDPVTAVEPDVEYKVKACAGHPVFENHRINMFRDLLLENYSVDAASENDLREMGQLMLESHRSYSACGLGNEATDELVRMVIDAGLESGVYGAKITGGGSGGTVCVMASRKKGTQTAKGIRNEYQERLGRKVAFFEGSGKNRLSQ